MNRQTKSNRNDLAKAITVRTTDSRGDEYNALETNKVQECHSRVNNVTNIFYATITGKRTGRVYPGGEIQGPIRSGSPRHFLPWYSKALWGVKASRPSARVVSIGRMQRRMLLNGNRYTLFRQPRVCFTFDSVRKWLLPLRPHPPSASPPTNQWSWAPFRSAARVLSRARRFASLETGVDNFFELATPDHPFFSFDESMNSRLETLQASTWRRLMYACTGNMLRQES